MPKSVFTFNMNRDTFKGGNYVKTALSPFWKGVYSTMEEFDPLGSKFFHFSIDPFLRRAWSAGKQTGSHRKFLPCTKWCKIYRMHPVPSGRKYPFNKGRKHKAEVQRKAKRMMFPFESRWSRYYTYCHILCFIFSMLGKYYENTPIFK